MIGWGEVYKVVVAMVPLYVALALGYLSVKRWRMFKPDQCDAINRFNCYFIMPFFSFHFTANVNPYSMNYRFLAGDVISKAIVGAVLTLWANLWRQGNFSWAITSFSLSSLNNTLVVGVPLLEAMYGPLGKDLVVQSSVIQALVWFPLLLFMLEFRRTTCNNSNDCDPRRQQPMPQVCSMEIVVAQDAANSIDATDDACKRDTLHCTAVQEDQNKINGNVMLESTAALSPSSYNLGSTMKKVWVRLAKNPNSYACALGVIWALLARRWDFEMPSIVEGSILIMAKAGSGAAMFSMGLFMALQEKVIACGVRLTMYGMALRFVLGPLTMAVGSLALGLRSSVLQIAIIQAALPQAIASFVFAQEYGLHANVLSTAVIFGTIVSLPLLIAYYAVLDIVH